MVQFAEGFSPSSGAKGKRTTNPKGKKGLIVDTGIGQMLLWKGIDFLGWCLLGFAGVTVFHMLYEPWISVGHFLVQGDAPIPGHGWVATWRAIGPTIAGWMRAPKAWVAGASMLTINAIQVMALLQEMKYTNLPKDWTPRLHKLAIAAWAIELAVALNEHSIYIGGFGSFASDFPFAISWGSFQWGGIISVVLLMFLFEFSICAGVLALKSIKKNRARSLAEARAKAAGGA